MANQVSVSIGDRKIVEDSTVHAAAGSLVALVGPSGSGKTTLLNTLGLLVRPTSGTVTVDGQDTTKWGDSQRRKVWGARVAFVFQDYGLIEDESVDYNMLLAELPLFGIRPSARTRVNSSLAQVGLEGRGREKVSALSGGEKQRVGLARAMFRRADAVFADEPTASLDRTNREMVSEALRAEADRGAAVIIATHDEELIARCDHRVHLTAPLTEH